MKFKRLGYVALAGMLTMGSVATLASCGKKEVPNDPSTIQLSYWKSGLGVEWLNQLIEKFEAKYPEYSVYLEPTSGSEIFTNTIELTDENTIDLYMTTLATEQYNQYYEPLNDVLNYQWAGEDKAIKDKIEPTVLKAISASDGNNYALSYGGGMCSIAYNANIIDGENYKVPNTTDELYTLVLRLEEDGIEPFISFEGGGYWFTIDKVWLAQYRGLDYYYNTLLQLDEGDGKPSKALLLDEEKTTGRYQVLKLTEKLYADQYVLPGSSSGKFTAQQTKFLSGQAAMMPNGTWLYNEMKNSLEGGFNYGLMKVPVLSAIIETLESVKTDRALSALITAIDAVSDKAQVPLTGSGYNATQNDVDRVWEARHMIFSCLDEHSAIIPKYSNAKEAAKTFLKFMYSDAMIHQYSDVTHLYFPAEPTDKAISLDSWNLWEKDVYNLQRGAVQLTKYAASSPVLKQAGLYAGLDMDVYFSARNAKDRLTADQFWAKMNEIYNENWDKYLYLAGMAG